VGSGWSVSPIGIGRPEGDRSVRHDSVARLILPQWLGLLGATVVGTASGAEEVATLREFGCPHPVLLDKEDFVGQVREVSGGKGAAIVYESVGVATFERSLDSARRFGPVASYGWPSGDLGAVVLVTLRRKGSRSSRARRSLNIRRTSKTFAPGQQPCMDC